MLEYLDGKIAQFGERSIVFEVGPLAFDVAVTDFFIAEAKLGQSMKLFTHLNVREDAMELYGFGNRDERNFFRLLISISGIGPKSAIGILSITTPDNLRRAISQERAEMLTKVSGIGKKTAERIIVELKNKFKDFSSTQDDPADEDLFDALVGLGYKVVDIRQVVKNLPAGELSLNEKIKLALKELSK